VEIDGLSDNSQVFPSSMPYLFLVAISGTLDMKGLLFAKLFVGPFHYWGYQ
jgi:hypothetical protein